jgi:hypothetical protein
MTEKHPATHRAYCAKRDGTMIRWLDVGVATPHRDGLGFDVVLDRLPVGGFNGHVLLRDNSVQPPEPEPPAPPSE